MKKRDRKVILQRLANEKLTAKRENVGGKRFLVVRNSKGLIVKKVRGNSFNKLNKYNFTYLKSLTEENNGIPVHNIGQKVGIEGKTKFKKNEIDLETFIDDTETRKNKIQKVSTRRMFVRQLWRFIFLKSRKVVECYGNSLAMPIRNNNDLAEARFEAYNNALLRAQGRTNNYDIQPFTSTLLSETIHYENSQIPLMSEGNI